MKTEPNESGARKEYFAQLLREICKYQTFEGAEETKYKERVLGISFDRVQELERRVEELENCLTKVQKDINWMCNEGKVLNRFVFNYVDEILNPSK